MSFNEKKTITQNHESVLPKTKRFWVRQGAGVEYDKQFGGILGWYVDESEKRPLREIARRTQGRLILDVGCGTGRHLEMFDSTNQLFGVDLSPEMLELAKAKNPHANFMTGSATNLPYPDHHFDLVFSVRVIQHIRDQRRMIEEMHRVCKPGGTVILVTYNSWSGLCGYKQIRMSRLGRLFNIPLKAVLKHRSFLNPWGFDYDNYCSIPEVSDWMKRAGLENIQSIGAGTAPMWFWNDLFVGRILQRVFPSLLKFLFSFYLSLDGSLARISPLKFITEKVVVTGHKPAA